MWQENKAHFFPVFNTLLGLGMLDFVLAQYLNWVVLCHVEKAQAIRPLFKCQGHSKLPHARCYLFPFIGYIYIQRYVQSITDLLIFF